MKMRQRIRQTLLVGLWFLLTSATAWAQVFVISPESARLPLNGSLHFRAQIFGSDNFAALVADRIDWSVEPEGIGKISENGFFMAGQRPGVATITAVAKFQNAVLRAQAKVEIGNLDVVFRDHLVLVVRPSEVALAPGSEFQFQAHIKFRDSTRVAPDLAVNWLVEPADLGKISQNGLFKAGNLEGDGHVIAYINFNGTRIHGRSHVVVGHRANAAIAGHVADEGSSAPIAEALIVAQRIGDVRWFRRTLSDQNGDYLLSHLIPGRYVVWSDKKGYVTEFYQEASHYGEALPVAAAANDTTEDIDFTLGHGGAIVGTIVSEVDSLPLPRVHVSAFRALHAANLNSNLVHHTMTDENGQYIIDNLRDGAYFVKADKRGYQGEYYDDVQRLDAATAVQVQSPDTTRPVDFALGLHSAISGQVISDADAAPIRGALVYAKNLNDPNDDKRMVTRTNENGEYVLELAPGFYLVGADADSFNHEFFDDVTDPALATPVEVSENMHVSDLDFSLAPLSTMSGMVTDQATGDPIPHASVYAYPEVGSGRPVKGETDENGLFTLRGLAPGIYFVKANARGYYPEFYQEAANLGDATPLSVGINEHLTEIDFTLTPAAAITGVVTAEDGGSPVVRALVVAKMIDSPFRRQAFSDANGAYRIDNLPAGTYIVFAQARGYQREFYDNASHRGDATPVALLASEIKSDIDFSLSEPAGDAGAISGNVVDQQDNLPIPGAILVAVAAQGGLPHFAVSDAEGNYGLKGLPSGDYYVLAWAEGYIGEFYDGVYDWRRATLVPVIAPEENPGIDFALGTGRPGPYAVRGRVVSRDDQPVANALVYAQSKEGVAGFAITDESGNYIMSDLSAGDVSVVASAPGFKQNNDDDYFTEDSVSVTLGSGVQSKEANITMDLETTTGVDEISSILPETFVLDQNYPNPFNPETAIHFSLPAGGDVSLKIYNVLGQEIISLVGETLEAGLHQTNWNGLNSQKNQVPSGIYFYSIRVTQGNNLVFQQVNKMTLMR